MQMVSVGLNWRYLEEAHHTGESICLRVRFVQLARTGSGTVAGIGSGY
jgi:hypothetical protein